MSCNYFFWIYARNIEMTFLRVTKDSTEKNLLAEPCCHHSRFFLSLCKIDALDSNQSGKSIKCPTFIISPLRQYCLYTHLSFMLFSFYLFLCSYLSPAYRTFKETLNQIIINTCLTQMETSNTWNGFCYIIISEIM